MVAFGTHESSLLIATVATDGEPTTYPAAAATVRTTVSAGSTKVSLTGNTSMVLVNCPAGIVCEVEIEA